MSDTVSGGRGRGRDGVCSRLGRALRSVHVEPFVCCYIISRTLMLLATQNLSLRKACRVNLGLSDEKCAALVGPKNLAPSPADRIHEMDAQRLVADMISWQLIIQGSVPCALAVFAGSWSDRNRKRVPCMLVPVVSELVRVAGLLACVYWFLELPMEVVGFVEAVPTSLAGGRMVLFNAIFSYVGDVTPENLKTLRIGIVNLLCSVGMAIGTALSGITFREIGFYGVYTVCTALNIFGLLYGLVFIKEVPSVKSEIAKRKIRGPCSGFFNFEHVVEAFKVTFKDGPHNRKLRIIMILCIAFLIMGPLNGDMSVSYLNTRVRFGWDEVKFSIFSTYQMIISVAGTGLCISLFSHVLKIDDCLIGVMACTGKIVAGIFYALATKQWVFYLGPLVDVMGGTIFITARSIMTKIVGPDELGQVTAIYGIVESLVPIVFGPLYSQIYKLTINTLPGAYSLVGSVLAIPATVIFIWMYNENKKSKKIDNEGAKEKIDVENELQDF